MTERERIVELAIIGAGPAGLAAAAEAAAQGVDTLVLDVYPQVGGQYFHLPSAEMKISQSCSLTKECLDLKKAACSAGAQFWQQVEVWGIYPEEPYLICLNGNNYKRLRAGNILIAAGAYERPVPFPGWTLPGVMTTGAALGLIKHQRILPGQRILMSGSGPLQLLAAAYLIESGAHLEMVLEARKLTSFIKHWRETLGFLSHAHLKRLGEGIDYLRTIRSGGVKLVAGYSIVQALGSDHVEAAVIARVDDTGVPIPGTHTTVDADTILTGYGLIPSTRLSRIAGCEHEFEPTMHTYVPIRDDWMQTTRPGIYVAGDAAEINGKDAAILEGRIAALGVAARSGRITEKSAHRLADPLRNRLANEHRFAHAMDDLFGYLPGLQCLAGDETIICRCENLTLAQIKEAVINGADSVGGVKNYTRAGMGWCQGRMCTHSVAQIISRELEYDLERASRHTVRPPLFPVPLEDLLEE